MTMRQQQGVASAFPQQPNPGDLPLNPEPRLRALRRVAHSNQRLWVLLKTGWGEWVVPGPGSGTGNWGVDDRHNALFGQQISLHRVKCCAVIRHDFCE